MGKADLSHKILAVAEGEGAERASYALKLLQSEGKLTIASTGKDPHSGRLETHDYLLKAQEETRRDGGLRYGPSMAPGWMSFARLPLAARARLSARTFTTVDEERA